MRYVLNVVSDVVGEYRFVASDYDIADYDYSAHYLLAGLNRSFNLMLRGTVMAGLQKRSFDNGYEDDWKPHLETSLRYNVTEKTQLSWINRFGYEDGELASNNANSRTGWNSSLNLSYSFSDRLRSTFGMTYHSYNFERPELVDLAEVMKTLNLGLNYRLYSNVDLNARYSYVSMESDDVFRDFVRHRISAGMKIKF